MSPEGNILRKHALLLAVLVAAVVPYFVGLGDSTIWDANEAFYAETAREMIESGDYINPSFNYQPRFNKPVLSYWAVAASYHLFGVSERSERLPIAVASIVVIATALMLGRAAGSVPAGLFAALAVATTPRFLMFGRRIIIDVWVTMFMALTLLFFVLAETRNEQSPHLRCRYLRLMYVAAGLGVLTKGPVAVVLPGLVFLIYLALERRLADLRRMMIPAGVLIVSAIVLPWYVALYVQHGWVHITDFFIDENVMRFAQPVGVPRRGLLFYLPVLLTDLFPWSLLLPVALAAAWAAFKRHASAATGEDRAQRILLIWIGTIVLFFTFSRTKQDLYILPVIPAGAALIGVVLARCLKEMGQSPFSFHRSENGDGPLFLSWSLVASGAIVGLLGLALLAFIVLPGRYRLGGSLTVALIALAGGAQVAMSAWRSRPAQSAVVLGAAFAALSWVFVRITLPDFERYKPVAPLVEMIKQRASPEARIGYYRFALPSMAFYLRRPVFEYFDPESLQRLFRSGQEAHCLMTAEDYRLVRDTLGPTYVVARRPLFDVKARSLLEGTAVPDILWVSNRP